MKVYVKRLNSKDGGFAIIVDGSETVTNLKRRIGAILDLFPESIRLLHHGRPLSNGEANMDACGIADGSRINLVYVPAVDMSAAVPKALCRLLRDYCPPNKLPMIAEQYQVSLAKKVENFSMEELERYAKFRNEDTPSSSGTSV